MELMMNTYKLLKKIKSKENNYFSGIGLVVYDSKFDHASHCDLRPDIKSPCYSVTDDNICDYFVNISDYHHTLHDGFHMMNNDGILTHVAQYFVPPVVKGLTPNQEHGVRLFSSMCGSTIGGVLFIGVISSSNKIYIFQSGEYINIDKLEEDIKNGA